MHAIHEVHAPGIVLPISMCANRHERRAHAPWPWHHRAVFIHAWDAGTDDEWRPFVASHGFGDLVAGGRDRDLPIVVPTQFVVVGDEVLIHLLRTNPIWAAIAENPKVLLCVSGDWAFIPSDWKTIG